MDENNMERKARENGKADVLAGGLTESPSSGVKLPKKIPSSSPSPDRWSSPGGFVAQKVGFYNTFRSRPVESSSSKKVQGSKDASKKTAAGTVSNGSEASAGSGSVRVQLFQGSQAPASTSEVGVRSSMESAPSSAAAADQQKGLEAMPLKAGTDGKGASNLSASGRTMKLPALWPEDHADSDMPAELENASQSLGKAGRADEVSSTLPTPSAEHPPSDTRLPAAAPKMSGAGEGAGPANLGRHSSRPSAPSASAAIAQSSDTVHSTQPSAGEEVSPQGTAKLPLPPAEGAGQFAEASLKRDHVSPETADTRGEGGPSKEASSAAPLAGTSGHPRVTTPSTPQGKRPAQATSLPKSSSGDRPKGRSPSQEHSPSHVASPPSSGSPGAKRFTVPQPFQLATDRRATVNRGSGPASPSPPAKATSPGLIRASLENPQVPPKPVPKPTTAPEPFNLESVRRHEDAQGRLRAELEARERAQKELHRFKAQPVAPPAPVAAPKSIPPTAAEGFHFSSDERAEKRKEYQQKMEEKELQQQQERASKDGGKGEEKQDKDLKEYRKTLAFKASPLPSFYKEPPKLAEIKKSPLPPTRAVSPKLGRKDKPLTAAAQDSAAAPSPDPKQPDRKLQAKPARASPKTPTKVTASALAAPGPSASSESPATEDAAVVNGSHATNGIGR